MLFSIPTMSAPPTRVPSATLIARLTCDRRGDPTEIAAKVKAKSERGTILAAAHRASIAGRAARENKKAVEGFARHLQQAEAAKRHAEVKLRIRCDMAAVRKEAINEARKALLEKQAGQRAAAKMRVQVACEQKEMKSFCFQDHERRVAERHRQIMIVIASYASRHVKRALAISTQSAAHRAAIRADAVSHSLAMSEHRRMLRAAIAEHRNGTFRLPACAAILLHDEERDEVS